MKAVHEKEGTLPPWVRAVEELKKIRIVRLCGDLDTFAVAKIEQFATAARRQKGYQFKHVLIDFAEVVSMDSSAVAALLKALCEYKKTHQKLALVNLQEEPRHMLRLAKVSHLFPSYGTEAQAIKDLETRF